jgi:hypothetical protein
MGNWKRQTVQTTSTEVETTNRTNSLMPNETSSKITSAIKIVQPPQSIAFLISLFSLLFYADPKTNTPTEIEKVRMFVVRKTHKDVCSVNTLAILTLIKIKFYVCVSYFREFIDVSNNIRALFCCWCSLAGVNLLCELFDKAVRRLTRHKFQSGVNVTPLGSLRAFLHFL